MVYSYRLAINVNSRGKTGMMPNLQLTDGPTFTSYWLLGRTRVALAIFAQNTMTKFSSTFHFADITAGTALVGGKIAIRFGEGYCRG